MLQPLLQEDEGLKVEAKEAINAILTDLSTEELIRAYRVMTENFLPRHLEGENADGCRPGVH